MISNFLLVDSYGAGFARIRGVGLREEERR
jgi:hypothetical protein